MKNNSSGNIFVDKLNTYQAANSDPHSLKKNFVVRINEFEIIVDALKSKKKKDPLQHELLLGRRGSGKSTLLKRIEIEINEDKKLQEKYIPVNLAEEQAGIYRLSDLWYECLAEIQRRTGIESDLLEFSEFEDDREYTRYLYDKISELLAKAGKKAVLLLDNIDRIFENLKDDGHLLRELLINHNNVQIIGASTRMDEHFWRYDQPFYEFFRVHHLEALTFEEINTLLNHWSKIMNIPELQNYAVKNRGKIEAIRVLTDGLPRTLQFFIRLLLTENNLYGFQYIKKIMDEATPLYQERLNNLTPPQRKIVLEMAFIWEATTTKQLINKVRMQSKLVSAYLKQLVSYGIVEKISTSTKNMLYRLSERFFNMWLIVTQGNPEQKRKAKYLTIFIENWYDPEEITALAKKHLSLIKDKSYTYDKAKIITQALAQSKHIPKETRDELIEKTYYLAESPGHYGDLPKKYQEIFNEIDKLINQKKFKKALKKANEIENEADGNKFFIQGYLFDELKKFEKAEEYYLLAVKKGHSGAMNNLAALYEEQGEFEKAEKYYLLAIKKGDADAMFYLADLYLSNNKNPKKALELIKEYNKIESNPMSTQLDLIIEIWNNIFEDLNEKINEILAKTKNADWTFLFTYLLYLGQTHLVLSYFESEEYGKRLRDKYILLYYAVKILAGQKEDVIQIIPQEVLPTVEDIIKDVEKERERYLQ